MKRRAILFVEQAMNLRILWICCVVALAAGGCATGGSDPRSAARIYVQALRDNDTRAAEACVVIHGDHGDEARDVCVEGFIVPRELDQLCQEKFGRSLPKLGSDDLLGEPIDDDTLSQALEAVETAQVQNGDANSAVLLARTYAVEAVGIDHRKQPLEKSWLGWRLVFDKVIQPSPAQAMRPGQRGWFCRQQLNIRKDVISGIRSGHLKSIKEVMAEINAKTAAIGMAR
jgi:hypothetical protein